MKSVLDRPTFRRLALAGAMIGCLGVGIAIDHVAFAQQASAPTIKRTVLQQSDDPGSSKYELIMAIAEIPAGGTSGKHFHHGLEMAYVLDGSVSLEAGTAAAKTFKAGDYMKNEGGAIHKATNTGSKAAKILGVYLVEKGKPLAEVVK